MVATTGTLPVFVAVNDPMLPVPLAPRPMDVLSLLQLYTVPATEPLKVTTVVAAPLHNTSLTTTATLGVGFTVMVNTCGVPVQVVARFV